MFSTGGTRLHACRSRRTELWMRDRSVSTRRAALFRRHQRAGQLVLGRRPAESAGFILEPLHRPLQLLVVRKTGYTFTNVVVAENDATAVHGLLQTGLIAARLVQTYPPQVAGDPSDRESAQRDPQ